MAFPSTTTTWHSLPNEMKLAIIDVLELEDIKSLSKVDQRTYQACVPAQFKVRVSSSVAPSTSDDGTLLYRGSNSTTSRLLKGSSRMFLERTAATSRSSNFALSAGTSIGPLSSPVTAQRQSSHCLLPPRTSTSSSFGSPGHWTKASFPLSPS